MSDDRWDSGFEDELEAEEYYMDMFGIEDDSDFEPIQRSRSKTAEQEFHSSNRRASKNLRELRKNTRTI